MSIKKYCEENNLDESKVLCLVLGNETDILPCSIGFTGYMTEIKETSIICRNEKLKACKEIPFSSFQRAEFGIGSGNLWLQCAVDGSEFSFCMPRKAWKSPQAQLLLKKISEHTELLDKKEYDRFMGKLFWLYMFK